MRNMVLVKTRYAYHYQDHVAELIFRYDNAAHHQQAEKRGDSYQRMIRTLLKEYVNH